MFPHFVKVYRIVIDDEFEGTKHEELIYKGICRSFTNTTTDGDSKLVTNMRKTAIPIPDREMAQPILAGDIIEVWKGKEYNIKEYGKVTDFKSANFGTEIFWLYGRN